MQKANSLKGKFGDYMTVYYAGTESKNPRFATKTWTFQDVFNEKFSKIRFFVTAARTNNPCEALNSALKHGSPELPNPNDNPAKCLYKFIEFIKFRLIFTSDTYKKMVHLNRHHMYLGHSSVLRRTIIIILIC